MKNSKKVIKNKTKFSKILSLKGSIKSIKPMDVNKMNGEFMEYYGTRKLK